MELILYLLVITQLIIKFFLGNYFKVKLEQFGASEPIRASDQSCGLDLFVNQSGKIVPGDRILVNTGLSIELPIGTYGKICSRSSLAMKGIDVGAGIIDSDYRGPVKILLINNGKEDFNFSAGERLAQLIITEYCHLIPKTVTVLNKTKRQISGFGSSGLK